MDATAILVASVTAAPLISGNYIVYRLLSKTREDVTDVKSKAEKAALEATHAHSAAEQSQMMLNGNGRGDIVKMVTQIAESQSTQSYKLDSVLAWQGRHEARHEREASQRRPDAH